MKPSFHRRIRRSAHDAATPRKDSRQNQQFFGESITPSFFQPLPVIQRKCADCEKEENKIQQHADKKEDKLQKKEVASSSNRIGGVGSYINSLNGKGNSLPAKAKQFFAARMGFDFSQVKIHTDKEATQSARTVNAKAYTIGNNIVFNEGQFNDESGEGKKLLAHELMHVLQNNSYHKYAVIQRQEMEDNVSETEDPVNLIHFEGDGDFTRNTTHEANCSNVRVKGKTTANYSNSFSSDGTQQRAKKCKGCAGAQCITSTGTITSEFNAAPSVFLPSPPAGLSDCETSSVQNFIDGTLSQHEQQHVDAFNTYVSTITTPYTYNGCLSGLEGYIRAIHNRIEAARRGSSDRASKALDANGANIFTVTCNCP